MFWRKKKHWVDEMEERTSRMTSCERRIRIKELEGASK